MYIIHYRFKSHQVIYLTNIIVMKQITYNSINNGIYVSNYTKLVGYVPPPFRNFWYVMFRGPKGKLCYVREGFRNPSHGIRPPGGIPPP